VPPSDPPVFICLGTQEPRKNFELAIRALGLLARTKRYAGARLRIIGMRTAHEEELKRLAAECAVEAHVDLLGEYMPRNQIVRELLACTALLFVSRYEGYGMPPMEAMSIGCPVVLSDIPAHRCVYGDGARWDSLPGGPARPPFINVDDTERLAAQMQRLLDDADWRMSLGHAGLAYSGTFSSESTTAALLDAFSSVADQ
jgi:glycosyltransferase involved in cell wall biosynthesis